MRAMIGHRGRWAAASLGLAAAVGLAGCQYTGTGKLTSETGTGVAEFTFDLKCPTGSGVQSGTLDYQDRAAGVALVATASGSPPGYGYGICAPNSYGLGVFSGTYVTPDGSRAGGQFVLAVTPSPSGAVAGGTFYLSLQGGALGGYHNSGTVLAGSIKAVGGASA